MKQNGVDPFYYVPIPDGEFCALLKRQIQEKQLSDPQDVIRHQQAMERDAHKSALREEEYAMRQQLKQKDWQMVESNGEILMEVIIGQRLKKKCVFSCQIVSLYRYKYDDSGKGYWNILLRNGNCEIFSRLYPDDYLESLSKLQKTALSTFAQVMTASERNMAWRWLQSKLQSMYTQAEVIALPYLAGWFENEKGWRFVTRAQENALTDSAIIKNFSREYFENVERDELFDELMNSYDMFTDNINMSVLLIFRMLAFLVRLGIDSPPPMGLTLIGQNAVDVAKNCLRTMNCDTSDWDIINLDSDRMGRIRESLRSLQDTPLIFISSNPDNRSTVNRLEEVLSWMQSGYMERKKVTIPFIFCLQKFSPAYPLDRTTVITTEGIHITENFRTFAKLQSLIIMEIEKSGIYWAEEFKFQYRKLNEKPSEDGTLALACNAIVITVLRILNLDGEKHSALHKVLKEGLDEISRQYARQSEIFLEVFQKNVVDMVDGGEIAVIAAPKNFSETEALTIFYDENYYYFDREVLAEVAEKSRFDKKAMLFVKQVLVNQNLLKQYQSTAGHRSEFEVDIFVNDGTKRNKVSVLAIKSEFWDKVGGVALWERSL